MGAGMDFLPDEMYAPLSWDSAHFGFPVAQVQPAILDERALGWVLHAAQQAGFHLVYCSTPPGHPVSDRLLRHFKGMLVDRKVQYEKEIDPADPGSPSAPTETQSIREYPGGEPSPRLLELAVAAGVYSRFRVDPRLPQEKFHSLYWAWMRRSTRREVADVVLVASTTATDADIAGMVTVAMTPRAGKIGLIAVHPSSRGQGLGRRLLQEVECWLRARGCPRVTVVTQQDNLAACRLYEKAGFRIRDIQHYYHFWPQESKRVA